ncbi:MULTISPECIES: Na/Pi cotransporter family protein [unclassified Saccharicrinis]|uniref:Na/Pi cotransporter family protein n=1 Tax=unclassified Saccharicrinis TaxID=2646859 RepID=UPI003D32CF67
MNAPDSFLELVFWLTGGLALFLYGIDIMGKALRKAAGLTLRRACSYVTKNRLRGVATGTVITGLIQSSSASTVIVVGLISAGLLTFKQSISLILGANLGTTITPQITALKIDQYAIPMLGIGFILTFITRKRLLRKLGYAIMGFGMLFLGLILMKFSFSEYTSDIHAWMESFSKGGVWGYLGAFLAATAATALLQSSSAMVVMIQLLFVQGALPGFHIVIPLILGAEVGTCITALLASMQGSLSAKRAAVSHLAFNLIGAIVATALFAFYLWLIPKTTGDPARQVANAHLFIRLINVAIFIPVTGLFARLVVKMVPGEEKYSASPEFLDTTDLKSPQKALANVKKEVCRLAKISMSALTDSVKGFLHRDQAILDSVITREETVDELCKAITHYTMQLSRRQLPRQMQNQPLLWLHIMSDIERISDHAENIAQLKDAFPENEATLNKKSIQELEKLLKLIQRTGNRTIAVMEDSTKANVVKLIKRKEEINQLVDTHLEKHEKRVTRGDTTPIGGILYAELITNLRRASNHMRNVSISVSSGGPELTRIKRKLREKE